MYHYHHIQIGMGLNEYREDFFRHLFKIFYLYNKINYFFISDSAIQMGRSRGKHVMTMNEQDSEPTYQGLIIENGMLTSNTS